MKQFTSTLLMLLACMYLSAQPGTPDAGFNASGTPGYVITDIDGRTDSVKALIVNPSDKSIYVTGNIANDQLFIIHYLSDGSLDNNFGVGGIVKYKMNGNSTVGTAISLQSDGTIVVAGWTYDNYHDFFVGRFDPTSGAVLSATSTNVSSTPGLGSVDEANALVILPNDKIIVTGFASSTASGNEDIAIAGYTAAGALDVTGFKSPTGYFVQDFLGDDFGYGIAYDKTSGDVAVVGKTSDDNGPTADFAILRISSTGGFVTSFNGTGKLALDLNTGSEDEATAVAFDRNGNIVVAGNTSKSNPKNVGIARLTPAGTLDPTFGGTGIVITDFSAASNESTTSLVIQNDNKIVVGGSTDGRAGSTYDLMLLRYSNAGVLDATFGNSTPIDGKATINIPGNEAAGAIRLNENKIYFAGNTTTNSDVALAVFNNDAVALPLVLTSFYAQKQLNKVVLQWQTSSEEDVKQFVIERSSDGKTYKTIGTVAATGNSSLTRNYSFADQAPYMSSGNYYRLLMQDADGAYKYSKILIINFDGQLTASLSIFPNPTKDVLQVQLPDGMKGNVALQVIDINGRVVKLLNLASDGSALNTNFDVSNLISGVYVLKAQAGNATVTKRFIKK